MAENRIWLFANNPFERPARNSDENAILQTLFHLAALEAHVEQYPLDTDYPVWLARFSPLSDIAESNYANYYSVEDAQEGKTANVNIELKKVKGKTGKARDWYTRTAAIYAINNPPKFKTIWGDGLKPFYKGGKDDIISALKTLSDNIGSDVNVLMVAIKAEVDATYGILNPSRKAQKTAMKTTRISAEKLNESLRDALEMQYGDLGLEIDKFRSDPDKETKIKSFHYLEIIQNYQQKIFNVTLHTEEVKDLLTRTFVFTSKFRAKVEGGSVKIYLSTTPGGINSTSVDVTDLEIKKFTAADFAITNYKTHRYITIVVVSGTDVKLMLQMY